MTVQSDRPNYLWNKQKILVGCDRWRGQWGFDDHGQRRRWVTRTNCRRPLTEQIPQWSHLLRTKKCELLANLFQFCFAFAMIRFCCTDAIRSHYSVFVQKRRVKYPLLSVHIDPPDNKCGGKDIHFCAFILLRFTLIQSINKNLHFCGYPLSIACSKTSVLRRFCADQRQQFHKNWGFSLRFCTKNEAVWTGSNAAVLHA